MKKIKIALSEDEKQNPIVALGRLTEYEVPDGEEATIVVECEQTNVVAKGAKMVKTSRPRLVKLDLMAWLRWRKTTGSQGFDHIRIIYFPDDKVKGFPTVQEWQRLPYVSDPVDELVKGGVPADAAGEIWTASGGSMTADDINKAIANHKSQAGAKKTAAA